MLSKNCPECSDGFSRLRFHPNIQSDFGTFWKFVRVDFLAIMLVTLYSLTLLFTRKMALQAKE